MGFNSAFKGLITSLDWGESLPSNTSRFTPVKGPRYPWNVRMGRTFCRRKKCFAPNGGWTSDGPVCSLVTMLTTLLHLLAKIIRIEFRYISYMHGAWFFLRICNLSSQEILLAWNPKIHHRILQRRPLAPKPSHIHPRSIPFQFYDIHFNIIFLDA